MYSPSRALTLDKATKVNPVVNSVLPRDSCIFDRVSPCDLWTVTAQPRRSGICVRETVLPLKSNVDWIGVIGSTETPSGKPSRGAVFQGEGGPEYVGQETRTATGRSERSESGAHTMSST
ncbi:hypothetical protein BD626DRAFT_493678 [Schizophyllum amplum]|uniref:Uncharacterized protein n=1 Tax=Schizophyllum amplum TaxID=97359 RepID=A0A550CGY6_9AGAR|nr:hypothetical protein BD626DRAFT_493678 [Auriculariopsis ampla]